MTCQSPTRILSQGERPLAAALAHRTPIEAGNTSWNKGAPQGLMGTASTWTPFYTPRAWRPCPGSRPRRASHRGFAEPSPATVLMTSAIEAVVLLREVAHCSRSLAPSRADPREQRVPGRCTDAVGAPGRFDTRWSASSSVQARRGVSRRRLVLGDGLEILKSPWTR